MKPEPNAKTCEQPMIATLHLGLTIDMDQMINWDAISVEPRPLYALDIGRPAVFTRLMACLKLFKHTFDLSDEQVVTRWTENHHWPYLSDGECFRHKPPINPIQMTRWRQRIGEKRIEKLLQSTIKVGKATKTITQKSFEKATVETTAQPKAVQHPAGARLYRKVHAAML